MSVSVEITGARVTDDAYLEGTLFVNEAFEIECAYNPFTFSVLYDSLQDELMRHGVPKAEWSSIEHAAGLAFGEAWEEIQPSYAAAVEKFNESISFPRLATAGKDSFAVGQREALLAQDKLELVYGARLAQHVAAYVSLPKEVWTALDEVWHKTRSIMLPQATAEGWAEKFVAAMREADERWGQAALSIEPVLEDAPRRPFKVVEAAEHVIPHVVIDTAEKAALLFKGGELTPYVAAFGYDEGAGTWSQGHYFSDLADAVKYFRKNYAPERSAVWAPRLPELSRDELLDLLEAYDSYIMAATEARLPETGWTPVGVNEFFECEYQNAWLAGEGFDYMLQGEIDMSADVREREQQKARAEHAPAKPLDGGYAMLSENIVVKPGDALERVYRKQLELSDRVWFGVLDESDENASTVMFAKEADGTLRLMSDNYFANSALVDMAEDVWAGKIAPAYVSAELRYNLDCIAEQWGWEKPPLEGALQRGQVASSLHEATRAMTAAETDRVAPAKGQKH